MVARSRDRHARYLKKKLPGKEVRQKTRSLLQFLVSRILIMEHLLVVVTWTCCLWKIQTPTPVSDPDLLKEPAILREFLDTSNIESDESDDNVSLFVLTVSIHPQKGDVIKRCSR